MMLNIELIPSNSYGNNLRKLLRGCTWDRLRYHHYQAAGHRCECCFNLDQIAPLGTERNPSRLECHEEWEYDDDTRIQKLVGVVALCSLCHQCKHIGRTLSVGGGKRAIRWLATVNEWSLRRTEEHINAALIEHTMRSVGPVWMLDLSMLQSHPALTEQDRIDLPVGDRGIYMGEVGRSD